MFMLSIFSGLAIFFGLRGDKKHQPAPIKHLPCCRVKLLFCKWLISNLTISNTNPFNLMSLQILTEINPGCICVESCRCKINKWYHHGPKRGLYIKDGTELRCQDGVLPDPSPWRDGYVVNISMVIVSPTNIRLHLCFYMRINTPISNTNVNISIYSITIANI